LRGGKNEEVPNPFLEKKENFGWIQRPGQLGEKEKKAGKIRGGKTPEAD